MTEGMDDAGGGGDKAAVGAEPGGDFGVGGGGGGAEGLGEGAEGVHVVVAISQDGEAGGGHAPEGSNAGEDGAFVIAGIGKAEVAPCPLEGDAGICGGEAVHIGGHGIHGGGIHGFDGEGIICGVFPLPLGVAGGELVHGALQDGGKAGAHGGVVRGASGVVRGIGLQEAGGICQVDVALAGADEIRQAGGLGEQVLHEVGQAAAGVDAPSHAKGAPLGHEFKEGGLDAAGGFAEECAVEI